MKKLLGTISLLILTLSSTAHHIIGGEMYYTFKGKNSKGYQYEVTLKLYRGCEPQDKQHSLLDPSVQFSIFNNDKNKLQGITSKIKIRTPITQVTRTFHDPCLHNVPSSCYRIGYYTTTLTLPANNKGYTIAYQRCCRDDGLLNANTTGYVGATYFTQIPGKINGILGDNSPRFSKEEAILICSKGNVDYTLPATDPDGDQLKYDFAPGYTGGSGTNLAPAPTSSPPFPKFHYYSDFSGKHPLGKGVTIDSGTGRIHGRTHLRPGVYDVTIRVRSYRHGKLIATHLHDFQFQVNDCKRDVLADTPPLYNECNSNTIHFANNSTTNKNYLWDFNDGETSTQYSPTHTFKKPGTYKVWLKVNRKSSCGDSIQTTVKVYPKLKPDFVISGKCAQSPVEFQDRSTTTYGKIDSYHWDFGTNSSGKDSSNIQNPKKNYPQGGKYPVRLTVTTDLGCEQTIEKSAQVYAIPDLQLSSDTILCYKDPFHLKASSSRTGNYLWTSNYRINNQNIADPIVTPQKDTSYKVIFTDQYGCVRSDSVRLRVKHQLQLSAGKDTSICAGDPIALHATSDEDYAFTWLNSKNNLIKKARDATPKVSADETYKVIARLGSCEAEDSLRVQTAPYPHPKILPEDSTLCYGESIQLIGSGGAFYQWESTTGGSQSQQPSIDVRPDTTTTYILTVTDTLGCPKAADTRSKITIVPPVHAFAGHDTIITIGTPFQLHAKGGDRYQWTPSLGLSNPHIANPMVTRNKDVTYRLTAFVDPAGCVGYDSIHIRYLRGPEIYVPSAFTPNGDGENDIFRPIPVGITEIRYFSVYDRWGKRMYSTKDYMKGWDGTYKGKAANQGAYVWMVKAMDFNGHEITKKGSVLLIR